MRQRVLVLAACWLLWPAAAQEFRATLTGRVVDQSDAVVPGATVRIENAETREAAAITTDSQGGYTAPFLRPGTYSVSVEAAGFKKFVRSGVLLNVGQTAVVEVRLEIGSLAEQMTVSAAAPLLESAKSDRGQVIDAQGVREFALVGRNPFLLAVLSPGVSFNGPLIYQRPFEPGAVARLSINGTWNQNSEFLLDGAPNNAQAGNNFMAYIPPVDAVDQFKIQANSYDAQYGKSSGSIINVSLKSGTNELHGAVYEFARRNAWDANSFQNNARNVPRIDHFLDHYGGAVGGPILLPKLYDGRNRSFFFFNYEGYREGTPTPLFLSVPAPEFLQGDFSKLADAQGRRITIYNPATGRDVNGTWVRDPFAANIIPSNRLNPVAQKILGYQPKPNTATTGQGYSVQNYFKAGGENLDKDDFYNLVIKFDQNISSRQLLFFRHASNDRMEWRNTNGVEGPGWAGPSPFQRINDAYVLDWVGTFTPTFLGNMRVSFGRFLDPSGCKPNKGFDLTTIGFPQSLVSRLPGDPSFGTYAFTDYNALGCNSTGSYTNTWAAHPTVTKIQGSHSIKAGVDMRWIQYATKNEGNRFRLTGERGSTQREWNRADSLSGNSIASFLLGTPAAGTIDFNVFPMFLYRYFAPYFQDDWKISRKLTLNLGLRWDFNVPPNERFNRLNRSFDPETANPADKLIDRTKFPGFPTVRGGLLFAGVNGRPRIAAGVDKTAVQPRAGFAYQLSSRIVMRGGMGKFYLNPSNDYLLNNGFSVSTPLINSLDGGRTPIPNLIDNPFPDGPMLPAGSSLGALTYIGRAFDFFDPDFKLPYVYQFSFGFQLRMPLSSVLDVSYAGNRTHKLQTSRPYNDPSAEFRANCNPLEGGKPGYCDERLPNPFYALAPFEGTSLGTSPTVARNALNRPFPAFGALTQNGRNDGKVWYDSLQLSLQRRSRNGLTLTFSYTLSKMIEQQGWLDAQRYVPQRGLYQYDRPHSIRAGSIWQLPFGRSQRFLNTSHPVWSRLVGGWEHTVSFQYSTGTPWALPGNVRYLKEGKLPDIDWSAPKIQAVRPCVARYNTDNTITLQPYSVAYGCTGYNFLILPQYAPREASNYDGRSRLHAVPQADMSLNKLTRITEKTAIQFRAEAFNVFNTFYFPLQQFNNNAENANFGQLIKETVAQGNANFPRQIQLAVKFIF